MFPLTWISCVFKLRLVCWCGSVQTPRVKTDECKDLQLLPVRFSPSNDVSNTLTPFYLLLYFLFPLLSSFPHLYHVFPIHSGCLIGMLLHQTQTATQSCTSSSLPLSFSMGLWNCQSAVGMARTRIGTVRFSDKFQVEVIISIPLEWGLWSEQGTCVPLCSRLKCTWRRERCNFLIIISWHVSVTTQHGVRHAALPHKF